MGILDPKPPTRAELTATYALKSEVAPTTLDGGDATSTYTGTSIIDGGSAA